MSSGIYLLNDICDLETDKLHPVKRFRPLAAGTVSIPLASILSALLIDLMLYGLCVLGVFLYSHPPPIHPCKVHGDVVI